MQELVVFWIFWLATSLNGGRSVFKMGLRLQAFTGLAFVAALAWGWYECPSAVQCRVEKAAWQRASS